MAQVNIDVAKEASVQEVNTKVGTSSDTASSTPTTLFAGIKGLMAWFTGTWTVARAAKIDTIDTNAVNIINYVGTTSNTNGTTTTGTAMAKLNALLTNWTSTRAGYIDTINTNVGDTTNTGGTTTSGTMMAKLNALISGATKVYVPSSTVREVLLNSELVAPAVSELKVIGNFTPKANGVIKVVVNVYLSGTQVTLGLVNTLTNGYYPTSAIIHSKYYLPIGTVFTTADGGTGGTLSTQVIKIPVASDVYTNGSFSMPVIKGIPISIVLLGSYGGKCNYCAIYYDEVI